MPNTLASLHRPRVVQAEITAGPYGVAGWQAEEEASVMA